MTAVWVGSRKPPAAVALWNILGGFKETSEDFCKGWKEKSKLRFHRVSKISQQWINWKTQLRSPTDWHNSPCIVTWHHQVGKREWISCLSPTVNSDRKRRFIFRFCHNYLWQTIGLVKKILSCHQFQEARLDIRTSFFLLDSPDCKSAKFPMPSKARQWT